MATANFTFPEPISHVRWNLPIRSPQRLKPQRCGSRLVLAVTLCSFGTAARADLPLSVESILADKGKTKLNLSLAYSNRLAAGLINSDTVVGTASLRYGLTDKTEIYARGSGQYSNNRASAGSMTDTRFQSTWAGASYQFKEDTETPALIGFVEGSLVERGDASTYALKSWAAGFTTYKSVDPLVFVLSGYYSLNLPRKDGDYDINPGNTLTLNPSIAFSVNDRVTLNTGIRWTNTWSWHSAREVGEQNTEGGLVDKQSEGNEISTRQYRKTNTDLQLGVDYGFSDDNILNVTFSANLTSNQGTNLRFDWLHTF